MPYLDKKVAIVTGASTGIGSGIASILAREGAKVVVNYNKSEKKATDVITNIQKQGGTAIALRADVTSGDQVKHMVDEAIKEFSKIDILVNNAGIARPNMFTKTTEDDWDAVMSVNLKGMLLCTHAVIGHMLDRKSGNLINISSVAGKIGPVRNSIYSMTKAGIIGFTRSLASEFSPYGINVNCVAPGPVAGTVMFDSTPKDMVKQIINTLLVGRVGNIYEVGELVAYLASERASYITGQCLSIDGGRSMQ